MVVHGRDKEQDRASEKDEKRGGEDEKGERERGQGEMNLLGLLYLFNWVVYIILMCCVLKQNVS